MSAMKKNGSAEIKNTVLWSSLSFVAPAVILAVAMAICGITPFGDKTLISDQSAAWFESFSRMYQSVVSGQGVFYHLNVGFGRSFYSEFASGLCSPFMFFALFFGQRSLAAAYSIITVIRAGAAGAAAWYMLNQCTDAGKCMSFALSCGYSLCGFTAFAAYYPSVADGAVFLPLLTAGIFHYVQASRPVRLFVFATAFFLTCPRLTVVGIIFSLVAYAAFYLRKGSRHQRVYKSAMFAATLLCSAAANAVLTIPALAGSAYYKNGVFSPVAVNDIFSDLCFGGYGTSPSGGAGLCLAGLLIMGLSAFFFNTRISVGEKISVASGIGIVAICHTVAPIAKYALGFVNADGEAVNAGFMLALLAVYGTARNLTEREGNGTYSIAGSIAVYAVMAALSAVISGKDAFALIAEAGLAIFACAVFVQLSVVGLENAIRLSAVTAVVLTLFGAVHCAGAMDSIHSQITAGELRYIEESRAKAREQLEKSYLEKNEEVPRFYRTRSTDGVSDSVNINRNEVEGLTEFAERLGIMRGSEYGGADNFTEFTDILFGITHPDYGYYSEDDLRRSACSPAYLTGSWSNDIPDGLDAFGVQNDLAQKWFGVTPFETVKPTEQSSELSSENERYKWTFGNETTAVDRYVIEIGEGESLYMLAEGGDYSFAVDSDSRSDWHKGCSGGIYHISPEYHSGSSEENAPSQLTVYISADASQGTPTPVFWAYRGRLDSAVRAKGAQYISYRGSTIRFLFDVQNAQTALTSIPYESGWEITVNGSRTQPEELCGGLIGIPLQKGKNSVVMKYTPPYFNVSLWISAIMCAMGLYITLKVEHEAERRRKVRMAFRAVELNISRMTVDQLDSLTAGGEEKDVPEETGAETSGHDGGHSEKTDTEEHQKNESEETPNEEI